MNPQRGVSQLWTATGRTWLRMLMSRFFQIRYDFAGGSLIKGDNAHYRHNDIPRVCFTHDSYLHYYTGNFQSKIEYRKIRTMLLVRHPADVSRSRNFFNGSIVFSRVRNG
jgi:hypothetical protein